MTNPPHLPLPTHPQISGVVITGTATSSTHLCPDLLSLRNLGAADTWRGHLVRGFFRLLRVMTGV